MSTFILIHGSWHGAWNWHKVVPQLQKAGHTAIALDLPGHGRNWTPPADISLQDYVDCVCRAIDEQTEPVILVGHSRSGIVLSQVAEYRPDKIKLTIYLAAYLIPGGQAMLPMALSDTDALILPNLILDQKQGWHMLKEEAFKPALYADCPDEDLALCRSLLTPEPNAPSATPLQLTGENFGRVPRVYIECLQDRAVSPKLQKQMYTALSCQKVISMNTSHSPFFSAPEQLTGHLLTLERDY